jgi:hypothetical protein
MHSEPDKKLTLEWVKAKDGIALVFDRRTWKIFEGAARARDDTAEHMILSAVVQTLGTVLMDNYTLNRFLPR